VWGVTPRGPLSLERSCELAHERCNQNCLPILDILGMHLTQVAPTDGGSQRSNLEGLAIGE
jgi:hypothetical protein